MTAIKEKAVEMIRYMPDDSMNLIITMLEAVSEYMDSTSEKKTGCLDAFFSSAGSIEIDGEAVLKLREESMV